MVNPFALRCFAPLGLWLKLEVPDREAARARGPHNPHTLDVTPGDSDSVAFAISQPPASDLPPGKLCLAPGTRSIVLFQGWLFPAAAAAAAASFFFFFLKKQVS